MKSDLFAIFFILVYLAVIVLMIVSMWKVFTKAGQKGWKCLIPFYNTYVLVLNIVKRPILWFILCIIFPLVFIVIFIDLAVKFGKSQLFGIGLFFLPFIFFPILAFSDVKYDENATDGILEDLGK